MVLGDLTSHLVASFPSAETGVASYGCFVASKVATALGTKPEVIFYAPECSEGIKREDPGHIYTLLWFAAPNHAARILPDTAPV